MGVVSAFAQTLRRYTSLNHLAQAARAVLQNTSQINQMLSDLNRVDFANVQVTFSDMVPPSGSGGAKLQRGPDFRGLPTHQPRPPPLGKPGSTAAAHCKPTCPGPGHGCMRQVPGQSLAKPAVVPGGPVPTQAL